ncbi:phosphatase PAP2 family protein [Adhaeribacter swui]|uniref:Phosphatase PAP2 family protein n=2 Tax=Adhaeribacter swui TaxID=2086471 RepID=A0A7G7GBS8_9BACT|nr:phosphatase PAP2 family protein [Adhaeribacter swui]
MQRLKARYPGIFAFIRNRFKTGNFFGLPFTILLFLIFLNVAMLSELAETVINSQQLKKLDIEVSAALFNIRTPILSQVLFYFTKLGSVYGITLITTLAGAMLIIKKRLIQLVALLLSVLGSGITMHYSKIYFHRERPLNIAYYVPENSFSFPSGHSTSIMALIGIICYFIFIDAKPRWRRNSLVLLGCNVILLVGFSRIYLGVHFLTDVTAGYLLGFVWVLLAVGVMEYLTLRQLRRTAKLKALKSK